MYFYKYKYRYLFVGIQENTKQNELINTYVFEFELVEKSQNLTCIYFLEISHQPVYNYYIYTLAEKITPPL